MRHFEGIQVRMTSMLRLGVGDLEELDFVANHFAPRPPRTGYRAARRCPTGRMASATRGPPPAPGPQPGGSKPMKPPTPRVPDDECTCICLHAVPTNALARNRKRARSAQPLFRRRRPAWRAQRYRCLRASSAARMTSPREMMPINLP